MKRRRCHFAMPSLTRYRLVSAAGKTPVSGCQCFFLRLAAADAADLFKVVAKQAKYQKNIGTIKTPNK